VNDPRIADTRIPPAVRAAYAYASRRGIVAESMYIVQNWEEAIEVGEALATGKLQPRVYVRDPYGPAMGRKRR
jgi:hypothetical protein